MEKQKIPAWQSFRYLEVFKIEETTPAGEILRTSPTGWFTPREKALNWFVEEWVLASWAPSPGSYEITVLNKPKEIK